MQEELMYDQLMSIGTGKAYDKWCWFEETMQELAQETQQVVSSRIMRFDTMKNRSFLAFLRGAGLRIPRAF
jgi:hypothetical protein